MADVIRRLDKVVSRARPLFVAFDRDSSQRKGRRGKQFVRVVSSVCEKYGLMLLPIRHEQMRRWSERTRPTKWDIGNVIAKWFPALAGRLPPRRKPWESENDRIGIFVALAAAVAAWDAFRGQ